MLGKRITELFFNDASDTPTLFGFIIIATICCIVFLSSFSLGIYGVILMFGWIFNGQPFVLFTFFKGIVYLSISSGVFFGMSMWVSF